MAGGAIPFPVFQPAMRIITSITNAQQALVTTSFAHQYRTGLIVRLYIPLYFGMQQANEKSGKITVTNSTQFLIDIDTTNFDAFVIPPNRVPPNDQTQYAQAVPFAEVNSNACFGLFDI